jgi:hypothetical protein
VTGKKQNEQQERPYLSGNHNETLQKIKGRAPLVMIRALTILAAIVALAVSASAATASSEEPHESISFKLKAGPPQPPGLGNEWETFARSDDSLPKINDFDSEI